MKRRCARGSRPAAPSGGWRAVRRRSSSGCAPTIITSFTVDGRAGLLLAYHLWSPAARADDAHVFVLFRHVAGHPRAPAALQQSIDSLDFVRD